ncbi:MAG: response regulator [Candidatus Cloacimonetes bacterium]|nr:response regulator [Candidatus Cloacimonadota bacterium]
MKEKVRILVVDDDRSMLEMIGSALSNRESYEVTLVPDSETALQHLAESDFDTVISDISLPGMNGLDLLSRINILDYKLPVILITGFADIKTMQTAIKLGVYDFLRKPFSLSELQVSVKQAVQKRHLMIQNEQYTEQLELLVQKKAKELFDANKLLELNFIRTVLAMINALEASDIYTKGHSERVTNISLIIGQIMQLPPPEIKTLRTGAIFHDLGKIGIYQALLHKPASLSVDEISLIRQHPIIGDKIIQPIAIEHDIRNIVAQHHERFDGTGYPLGLKSHDISLLSKIVTIADAYDAMTSTRSYRPLLSHSEACEEIERCAGSQFDPLCVEYFLKAAQKQDFQALVTPPLDSFLAMEL